MAQLSVVLVSKSMDSKEDKDVYFMSIESTEFRKIVEPMYLYSMYGNLLQELRLTTL